MLETLKSRVQLLFEQERSHISKRGSNYWAAVAFTVAFVYVTHHIAGIYWPGFIQQWGQHTWHLYFIGYQGYALMLSLGNFLFYGLIDKYGWFEEYKITKKNLIWEVDPEGWRKLRNKAIKLNLFNLLAIVPAFLYLDSLKLKMSFSPEVPSCLALVAQLTVCIVVEAIFFYFFHRIAHEYLYQYHKTHHEFVAVCPLAANYNHPIDYVIGTVIPFGLGPKLLGSNIHFITLLYWGAWRICEGYGGHSNYNFPWSPIRVIPFSINGEYHSFHHTSNVGNYGSTMILEDTLTATNLQYFARPNSICYDSQPPAKSD